MQRCIRFLTPFFCLSSLTVVVFAEEPSIPDGLRLREIVAKHYPEGEFYIGGTTGWEKLSRGSGVVLDREFDYVTPENDFKQQKIHPSPGKWNWKNADAWVKRCKEKNQVMRLHGPISPQSSKWALADDRAPEELAKNMDEFMTALCKRYDRYEHVKWMDVVNETVTRKGEWFGPKPGVSQWENPWPKMGYDTSVSLKPPIYIKKAFQIANKYAPNTKLIFNQHGSMERPMWEKVKRTILYLRRQGLRVDGLGWQAHVNVGWEKEPGNVEMFRSLIQWAHANKLSFHVTENNVWLKGKKKDYQAQAKTFAVILKILLEERKNGEVTWNVWNISDADQWSKTKHWEGCLFYDDFDAKPAYYAIQKVLLEEAH
jgi:GH35 family endo-1,4-beta-xylanase